MPQIHIKSRRTLLSILSIFLAGITVVNGQDDMVLEGTDMSLEDLVNVKITIASKSEESISDAPGVISVITQDQLKRYGGTTLGDVLKRVPSLLGTTVYFTDRSVISSRGDQVMPSSSHILLLLNGRPMREVMEGGIKSEVYESFPVTVIERIEVIRGPGSVLYGSQAFSGVINIITKSADKNTVSVSGSLGENLYNNVSANVNYKIGDQVGLVLAARYADRGDWKTNWKAPNITGGIDDVNVEIPNYGPGLFSELTFKGLRLMYSYNQWTNQNFVPDYQQFKGFPFFPYGDATGHVVWKKHFGDIGYEHKFNDRYSASINGTYTQSIMESKMFPWTSRDAFEIVIEQTNHFKPVENFNILFGGVWGFMTGEEVDTRLDKVSNDGHQQNTFSGYLQLDYRWDWCKVIGGLQANKVADFDFDFNPRAGLIFYPFKNVNIKTLYSTAYRAPSLDELYLNHETMHGQMVDRDSADVIKDKNIKPEKVNTFDVGVNYQDEKVQFGLNGFHSKMKNLIIQDRVHYVVPTWDNIGEVTIFGLECEGKFYVTKEFLFEGSFLFQQSKDMNTSEDDVTPLPDFSAKGGLSYMGHGLTLSAFNTFWQQLDTKYSSTLNKTTGHFNMLNLNCSYNFNQLIKSTILKELSLIVSVDNLLDEEVWLPAWGLINGSRIPYNEGRTVYGGFKVTF